LSDGEPVLGIPQEARQAAEGMNFGIAGYQPDVMMTSPLPSDPSAAAAARGLVRSCLDGWGLAHMTDDVELVVSELVTNAVRYGERPISLRAGMQGRTLTLAVEDADPSRVPTQRDAGPDSTGGRGLLLIGAVSQRWGCTVGPSSKIVWAELSAD
jgi:anti-sigma regulatory factor (Ser/Thr protein kinase)